MMQINTVLLVASVCVPEIIFGYHTLYIKVGNGEAHKKEVEMVTTTKEIDLLAKALSPQDLNDQRKIYDWLDWAVREIDLLLQIRAGLRN